MQTFVDRKGPGRAFVKLHFHKESRPMNLVCSLSVDTLRLGIPLPHLHPLRPWWKLYRYL